MSENFEYDVLYIGAGHAAHDGAAPLAATGVKVAVVEEDLIGGTCTNRGCNAKIALDQAVMATRNAEHLGNMLQGNLTIDWPHTMAHKQAVIDPQPADLRRKLTQAGATVLTGHAQFQDAHTVLVAGTPHTAQNIVIATGMVPHRLAISGTELAHDSSDFLNLPQLPKHLTIIGSGYISLEFATIANAAGADVTIMLHGQTVLRHFYQPYVQLVVADLKRRGVTFIPTANVQAFAQQGDQYQVTYGHDRHLTTDWILDATGRVPNVADLGLDQVGLTAGPAGIPVNQYLQTAVPNIYAAGDIAATGQPKLTPVATYESKYLMRRFSGQTTAALKVPAMPSVVFTSPRIAQVGETVAQAQERGDTVSENDLAHYWYYQLDREPIAQSLQIHDDQGHLVGATEVSDHAPDAINALLPAITYQLDPDQVSQLVGIFPTLGYAAWHRA